MCPCVLCACPVRTTGGQEGGLWAGLSQAIMFSPSVFYRNTTQHNTAPHRGSIWDDNRVHAAPPPVPTSPTPSYTLLTKHRVHLAFWAFFTIHVLSNIFAKIGCFPAILETTQSFPPTESIGSPITSKIIWELSSPLIHLCSIESTVEAIDDVRAPPRKTLKSISRSSQISLLAPLHTSCRPGLRNHEHFAPTAPSVCASFKHARLNH